MKKIFVISFYCWSSIATIANVLETSSARYCNVAKSSSIVWNENVPEMQLDEEISEIAALEARMNVLLTAFHVHVADSVKRSVFEQDLAPFIYAKAEVACPTIKLESYMTSRNKFEVTADISYRELQLAVGILTDVVNHLNTIN
ncbi:MAG: hypothetical protein LW750_06940 [Bacteroidetes bacterium]|jgi:hypothetical protein|nr:hypothetical protein [Bacteroidota bacterium]